MFISVTLEAANTYTGHLVGNADSSATTTNASGTGSAVVTNDTRTLSLPHVSIGGNAATAGTATNWSGAITPIQFGAVGNGSTDDSLSVSNFYAALNTGLIKTGDLLGKSYYIANPLVLPTLTAWGITIKNGTLKTDSTNGAMIPINGEYFTLSRLIILNTHAGPPSTSSVGIYSGYGLTGGSFSQNNEIQSCVVSNFYINVELFQTLQTRVEQCFLGNCWSNMVYITGPSQGSDGDVICNNDLNALDTPTPIFDAQYTNVIAVNCDKSLNLILYGNNGGGCKQALTIRNTRFFEFNDNWEKFHDVNTNDVVFFFTNSVVNLSAVKYWPGTDESNYVAAVGLYGCDLSSSSFGQQSPTTYDLFGYTGVTPNVRAQDVFTVRTHVTFGDTGTVTTNSYGSYPSLTDSMPWFAYQKWQTGALIGSYWGADAGANTVSASTHKFFSWAGYRYSDSAVMGLMAYNSWGAGSMDLYLGSIEYGATGE